MPMSDIPVNRGWVISFFVDGQDFCDLVRRSGPGNIDTGADFPLISQTHCYHLHVPKHTITP
jgi:hypothetical protein